MNPPYYCPECDEFDTRRHDHRVAPFLVAVAVVFVLLGPAILLALYVTGPTR